MLMRKVKNPYLFGTLQFLAILKGSGESEGGVPWWPKLREGEDMIMEA